MCTTFLPKRGGNFIPGLFTCETTTFTQSYPNGKPLKTSACGSFSQNLAPYGCYGGFFYKYIYKNHNLFRKGVIHTMKIICSKSSLLKSVSIALKAVPSKTTMPILECILMDATTNQIKFTTNDMELGIETIVEVLLKKKVKLLLMQKSSMKSSDDFRIMILPLKLMINMQQPLPVKKQNSISPENQEKILLIYR